MENFISSIIGTIKNARPNAIENSFIVIAVNPNKLVKNGTYITAIEINDVIINPRGEILDDWNEYGELLNLVEYKRGLNKII